MAQAVQFSPVYGENVALDKHSLTARWSPNRSGSWMFSSSPLEAGREVHVTLVGSGHCDVGVIKTEPRDCDFLAKPSMFKKLNGIQIHKMKCQIPVGLNQAGNEVKSEYGGQIYRKSVEKRSAVWIAVYVKFGDISTRLVDGATGKLFRFSENHGTNIRLEESGRQALTISPNPAATCFLGTMLRPRGTIRLVCEPILEGNRKPSRFHLKLFVCPRTPGSYLSDFRSAFDTSLVPVSDPPFTVIEILEKAECDGSVSITLDASLNVRYVSATNKQNKQNLNFNPESGVWIGFELFRVSVNLKDYAQEPTELDRRCLDVGNVRVGESKRVSKKQCFDVVDARIRDPQNENQEDSIAPFESYVDRCVQNRRGETPYIPKDMNGSLCNEKSQRHKTTQEGIATNVTKVDPTDKSKKSTRKHPVGYLYENQIPKCDQPSEQTASVKTVQGEGATFNVDDDRQQTSPCMQTVPKMATIPIPMQVPIPNTSHDSLLHQWSCSVESHDQKQQQYLPSPPTAQRETSRVESAGHELASREDSVIVDWLSRIERKLSSIDEKVSVNHSDSTGANDVPHGRKVRSDLPKVPDTNENPIQKNWVSLVETICADRLCDHLYQAGHIQDDELQRISSLYKSEPREANRRLLSLIQKRNIPKRELIKIFRDAEQGSVIGLSKNEHI